MLGAQDPLGDGQQHAKLVAGAGDWEHEQLLDLA
jgi:hypothetical protein